METDGAAAAPAGYCKAAHILSSVMTDIGPCEGHQDVVVLLSSVETPTERVRNLLGTTACVHHGSQLYARLAYARVYPHGENSGRSAIEVYNRALRLTQKRAQERADAVLADAWSWVGGAAA